MKVVSVVIPVHNRVDCLRECLQSVARQTYPQLEVIVVDDASTEAIRPEVERIDWPETFRIITLRSDTQRGPGAARELGRQAVTGDFVCYLDSDDLYHREKIARQVAQLEAHPDAGMCYTGTCYFEQYPFTPTGDEPLRPGSDQAVMHFLPFLLLNKHRARPWATASCMWTAASVAQIGPWHDSWHWEDLFYDMAAGSHGITITHIPDMLTYIYRGPDVRLTHAVEGKARQLADVLLAMVTYLDAQGTLRDGTNRAAAQWFLLDHGLILLDDAAVDDAVLCFQKMLDVSPYSLVSPSTLLSLPVWYARLMLLLVHILPPAQARRIGHLVRYKPVGAWRRLIQLVRDPSRPRA